MKEQEQTVTINIADSTLRLIQRFASAQEMDVHQFIQTAIDKEVRSQFLNEFKRGYAALCADPEAWAEELAERTEWDGVLMDDLEDDEYE